MRWTALIWALPIVACALPALAQDIDDLDDLDEGVVLEEPFVRGIQPNKWSMEILFGYRDVSKVLLAADGIVVDVEFPDDASFMDMELKGQQSFSPQVRAARTFGRHFALELGGGFSLGDYEQTLHGTQVNWVDPESGNEITDTEIGKGSYWIWNADLSATWYPRGTGTVQPYLIGGVGENWYDIDSVYIDGITASPSFSYGAGMVIVGDELYSIRLEVRNYHTSLSHSVGRNFRTLPNLTADALVDFPISRLVPLSELSQAEIDAILDGLDLDDSIVSGEDAVSALPVAYPEYEKQTFTNLWFSLGFQATF
jgi:hypothetical protein